jgi:hypothetical protein
MVLGAAGAVFPPSVWAGGLNFIAIGANVLWEAISAEAAAPLNQLTCRIPTSFWQTRSNRSDRSDSRANPLRHLTIGRPWAVPQSVHRRSPRDRNAGSARPSCPYQAPRFLQPIGAEIGPQQRELDQIVLRAATPDAFVFSCERAERLDRRRKIPVFDRREAARQGRKVRAGRVTPFSRQFLHLASTDIERGVIAHDSLCQDDVQVGEPAARPRQCAVCVAVQRAPSRSVARMASEFGPPQKRRPIRHFLLRPAAVPVERDGVPIQPRIEPSVPRENAILGFPP